MAETCVVDTDVISYMFRDDTRAAGYRNFLADRNPVISFMTIAELERWALARDWGINRRGAMATFLERFTIIPSDVPLCHAWAYVIVQAGRNGHPISVADAWIAATALRLDAPLITNNRRDYTGVNDILLLPEQPES